MKRIVGSLPRTILVIVLLILHNQCGGPDPEIPEDILKIPISLEVTRFDRILDAAGPEDLPAFKKEYPYFFPERFADSSWVSLLNDTLQQQLREEVGRSFTDFRPYVTELELFFKHVAYYFPRTPIPRVLTITSSVDYNDKVILTDSLLLIGLDNYLGAEHMFYQGLANYIARDLDPAFIVSDVADDFNRKLVPPPGDRSFIARMVYHGKGMYLKDRLMPLAPDSVKIRYSASELKWARENENQIWRYFIEQELLYDTDSKLDLRFLEPAPFSKFGLLLDNESPGRIGQFIGWQIVRAYMEKNQVGLPELLATPEETLFRTSKYKPKK